MSVKYKVWLQIEEISGQDENYEEYQNINEPEELAICNTIEKAEAKVQAAQSIEEIRQALKNMTTAFVDDYIEQGCMSFENMSEKELNAYNKSMDIFYRTETN